MKARLFFALCVFGPVSLFFFLPLLFVRVPMVVFINRDGLTTVAAPFVSTAMAVCVVWFAIAAGIVIWPFRAGRPARSGEWTSRAAWWAFVAFSSAGSAVALLHAFRVLPAGIEESVHQLSLAPPIGFVFGVSLLRRGVARPYVRRVGTADRRSTRLARRARAAVQGCPRGVQRDRDSLRPSNRRNLMAPPSRRGSAAAAVHYRRAALEGVPSDAGIQPRPVSARRPCRRRHRDGVEPRGPFDLQAAIDQLRPGGARPALPPRQRTALARAIRRVACYRPHQSPRRIWPT